MCLLPVLKRWLQQSQLTAGEHRLACEAFLAVAELVQLLSDVQQWHVTDRALLLVAADWQDAMIPKCHWPLHTADCFGLRGYVPACFTVERKHKLVKTYATWQQNTTNFEYACMKVVLADDLHKLTAPMAFAQGPALVAPVSPAKSMRNFLAGCLSCLETEAHTTEEVQLLTSCSAPSDRTVHFLWTDENVPLRSIDWYEKPEQFFRLVFSGDEGTDVFLMFQHLSFLQHWVVFWPDVPHKFQRKQAKAIDANPTARNRLECLMKMFRSNRAPFATSKFGKSLRESKFRMIRAYLSRAFRRCSKPNQRRVS